MTFKDTFKRHNDRGVKRIPPSLLLCRSLPIVILLLFSCALGPLHAWPEVSFKHEFEDICSRTSEAESLAIEELNMLIVRCDKLRTLIEKEGDPEKTIYLKRLRMCKDLFVYVLESKKAATAETR